MDSDFIRGVEADLHGRFREIDEISFRNASRVLEAFRRCRVSDAHFAGTTGYGYNDSGRDTLDAVFAGVFGAEDALVRVQFVNGTHAISCALRAAAPRGRALSLAGAPYDTLRNAASFDIVDLKDGLPDWDAVEKALNSKRYEAVFIQKSRGYASRPALTMGGVEKLIALARRVSPESVTVVDNCYGEFVETREPPMAGADLTAGSLIKNPGGGLAVSGGYVCGKRELVEKAAEALTAPGIGRECGSSMGQNRLLYQGLFIAPHVVAQALKTACFLARALEKLGYGSAPGSLDRRGDIIQTVELGSPDKLLRFVRGIQAGSPVDSFAVPEPWDMPGYDDKVVMAAGAFVQGASIELSCDAPMREPYRAYLQGGLTYEAGKLGVLSALREMGELV